MRREGTFSLSSNTSWCVSFFFFGTFEPAFCAPESFRISALNALLSPILIETAYRPVPFKLIKALVDGA